MADALYGWINRILTGTLTAGSEEPLLPITNLKNPHGSADQGWQTLVGDMSNAAGANFILDSGVANADWRIFGLFRCNLTEQAEVRWSLSNNADMSALTYDSGWLASGIVPGFNQHVHVPVNTVTGRYLRCQFRDTTNPDAFLNVALAFCGPAAQPEFNFDYPSTFGVEDVGNELLTRGGAEYPEFHYHRRRWNLTLSTIATSELWSIILAWQQQSVGGNNVVFVPNPTSPQLQREALYGRVKPTSDISYPYDTDEYRAWSAVMTERL